MGKIDRIHGKILVFDTSVASENLGDLVIKDAVYFHLLEIFPESHFVNSTTHDVIGRVTHRLNRDADYSFVAGTNILSSKVNRYNQWKIKFKDALNLRNILLMGAGWNNYQEAPNIYTQWFYRKILHRRVQHSVRDQYTLEQLKKQVLIM